MRCRLYCKSNTLLDFPLLLKQGERTKHEEHDLVRRPRRTQCSDSICARFYQVRVAKLSVKRLYNSDNRSPVSLVRSTGDKGLVALRNSRKRAFCCRLRPFMPGITTSETDAFILIRVAESIFAARPPAKTYLASPASRRRRRGHVVIVARKHRGNASTRRCKATHLPGNCVAPTLTMQELLAAKAGRLMSV